MGAQFLYLASRDPRLRGQSWAIGFAKLMGSLCAIGAIVMVKRITVALAALCLITLLEGIAYLIIVYRVYRSNGMSWRRI